jgi:hypothetical protein
LEVLKEIAPGLKNVGVLFSRDAAAHTQFLRSAQNVSPSLGLTVTVVDIQDDLERAIVAYAEQQPDRGLFVFPHPKTIANRRLINELAIRYRTPAIYPIDILRAMAVSSPTGQTKSINGEARRPISIAFSRARIRPICRCRHRRSTNWRSISRRQSQSG